MSGNRFGPSIFALQRRTNYPRGLNGREILFSLLEASSQLIVCAQRNILISDEGTALIYGLSFSNLLIDFADSNPGMNLRWMSPHMLEGNFSTMACDVWGWAMTALEVLIVCS